MLRGARGGSSSVLLTQAEERRGAVVEGRETLVEGEGTQGTPGADPPITVIMTTGFFFFQNGGSSSGSSSSPHIARPPDPPRRHVRSPPSRPSAARCTDHHSRLRPTRPRRATATSRPPTPLLLRLCRGIDLKHGGRLIGKKHRTEAKSENVYVRLLTKVRPLSSARRALHRLAACSRGRPSSHPSTLTSAPRRLSPSPPPPSALLFSCTPYGQRV